MKKTAGLFFLLVFMVLGVLFLENRKQQIIITDGANTPVSLELSYDLGKLVLQPWYDDETGIWYVFFPSFVRSHTIDCRRLENGELFVDRNRVEKEFVWQDNTVYEFVYGENIFQIKFMEDRNLSTLFIETESRANEIIRENKENREEGQIVSLDSQGKIQYGGSLTISGHGNAWQFYDKRAYDIRLKNKGALAGMEPENHWKLLHLSNDGDKIHSKLAYDIAEILRAEYVPQTTWVNVYLNGEYQGMYLLATAVKNQDVFKTEQAVLLEKDLSDRYSVEEHVMSESGNGFTIHRPKNVDEERKREIFEMVQAVEDSVMAGHLEEELIDIDSFVIQFLIEEIVLNYDAFKTSCYVYQTAEGQPLCAGLPWDYDGGFGEGLHMKEDLLNPKESILNLAENQLTWIGKLHENPEFVEKVAEKYKAAFLELKELYTVTIDQYAEYIEGSVRNDNFRWKGNFQTAPKTGNYQTWENNLRYLKYFCMNRYNALLERYGIIGETLLWKGNEEEHKVKLLYDGREEEVFVKDGMTLDLAQNHEFYQNSNCVALIGYSEEAFNKYFPILEDLTIKLVVEPKVWETEDRKYIELPKAMFAEEMVYVTVIDIGSEGNVNLLLSAEPMRDLYLELEREQTGTIAIYVFADETAEEVVDEIMLTY